MSARIQQHVPLHAPMLLEQPCWLVKCHVCGVPFDAQEYHDPIGGEDGQAVQILFLITHCERIRPAIAMVERLLLHAIYDPNIGLLDKPSHNTYRVTSSYVSEASQVKWLSQISGLGLKLSQLVMLDCRSEQECELCNAS